MSVIIRMKNLPMTAGAADVRMFFAGLKIPDGAVHIIGGDEGEVFVGFASDEDARLAMNKQGQTIHNAKIRLLLSSKTEQNAVIEARKNGVYSSPALDDFIPPAPTQSSQPWPQQPAPNPFADRSGYEPSFPPQGPAAGYGSMNSYSSRLDNVQPLPHLTSPKKAEPPAEEINYKEASPREEYGYKGSFQSPPIGNRFGGGAAAQRAPEPPKPAVHMQNVPPMNQQHQQQQPPSSQVSPNNNYGGYRGSNQGPNGRMTQSGDSWRDSNYQEPKKEYGRNDNFNNRNGPPAHEFRKQPILPTPPSSQYQQAPTNNGPYGAPSTQPSGRFFGNNGPPQNGPNQHPTAPFSGINGPNSFQNAPSSMNRGGPLPSLIPPSAAPMNRDSNMPPHHFPSAPNPSHTMKPLIPPIMGTPIAPPPKIGEKYFIELTRLPNELLRPAALEAFVNPLTPLTLSSVKTVFGPGGIHIHTIIRLDSVNDFNSMMRRNGEQGIKIQQSDKKTFDSVEDVAPLSTIAPRNVQKEDDSQSRRKSRWNDKSPLKDRSSPRRGGNRSRSPIRKRRRSRSPRRREEHTDPTRWCIQVTNVPFRMKDEDLLEWFSEKVRPAKLSRTYYSDGNASDRWVAEFSSESLMRRAFSIRTLCHGRTLKLSYIDNEKADEIMKIEDVYGKEKRQINEEARIMQEEAEKANPPTFFNQPVRGAPPMGANNFNGPMNGTHNGGPPPPIRGGFAPRGNAFPPRGGMMGGPMPPPTNGRGQPPGAGGPSFFHANGPASGAFNNGPDVGFRGGYHGNQGFRGGRGGAGGPRGGFRGGHRDEHTRSEMMELIQSLGPQGTVLSCSGFPGDVTLEDVADFFGRYDPDRNSIRIRRGEDGVMTGDCMLACYNPNDAHQAAQDLDGQRWHNVIISVRQL